jgi:lipopolysaccharide assembly protein A
MRVIRGVLTLLFVVVLLVFVIQNGGVLASSVALRLDLFLSDLSPQPVALYGLLLIAFLVGLILGGTWWLATHLRLRSQFRRLTRLLAEKERELNSLRNLPVLEAEPPVRESVAGAPQALPPNGGAAS